MIVANFFIGLLFIVAGVLLIRFNFRATNMLSKNNVFERKLGSGSTYTVMLVLGGAIVMFGFMMMFSLHDNFFEWISKPLVNLIG